MIIPRSKRRHLLGILLAVCLATYVGSQAFGRAFSSPEEALEEPSEDLAEDLADPVKERAFFPTVAFSMKNVIGSLALLVLVVRARDFSFVPALVGTDMTSSLLIVLASAVIYWYEKMIGKLLPLIGLAKLPSILGAMLSLFAILRIVEKVSGRATGEKLADKLAPGVNFLGKWMGLFLAPPLAGLDRAVGKLPPFGIGVWLNTVILLGIGWATTCFVSAKAAHFFAPHTGCHRKQAEKPAAAVAAAPSRTSVAKAISPEEALRRVWVLVAAVGYVGVAMAPDNLTKPFGMLCELGTTVSAFMLAKLLPPSVQSVFHPLVVCAFMANMSSRYVGPSAPFLDAGRGIGDILVGWLPAAVTGLGVRMFLTTKLWFDRTADLQCVLLACGTSALFSLAFMMLLGAHPLSPLGVPAQLALPLLNRSVMSALGIEGAKAIGPECDPGLAVASILITGCIGASMTKTLFSKVNVNKDAKMSQAGPLVRGISMGCSAHSIGTAALIGDGDTDAAAISGVAMCLVGTAHTVLIQMPGMVPFIRMLVGI